ncbi:MAG: hypothetical protein JWR55_3067 [Aeromicrobium sp.]|nr:hypothetical protein [Aeromicrobium sp.]
MNTPGPDASASEASSPVDDEAVGSVAEEAFKLFRALAPGTDAGAGSASEHVCSAAWCPVCQVVGFVHDNPDAIASVKESALGLARSLRDLVDSALAPQPSQEEQ